MFVLLLPLHVDALSSLQQLQKTNPPESETHPVNKLYSGHFGRMLIVLFWGATASPTISRAITLPSGPFYVTVPRKRYVTSCSLPRILARGALSLLTTPVEDHMMLLCCFVMFCIWLRGEGPSSE